MAERREAARMQQDEPDVREEGTKRLADGVARGAEFAVGR
jgi:hypothetical protein